ncbi:RAMP superfamily CRISPR-associated protein [Actinomadura algeriensis]|nr:RAMP superfamily CRISPR-associated protein [Actinomadura algeriensis]
MKPNRRGRPMDRRLRLRGLLETTSPLHVGGIAADPAEVLPVAVDGRERLYVPGTSLAGAFRAWMEGADTTGEKLQDFWGFVKENQPNSGRASRVVVRDAPIASRTEEGEDGGPAHPLEVADLGIRDGVGIDRVTGAAAPGFLYARTVVPPGFYLFLELDIEVEGGDLERDRARLAALIAALRDERVRLGASGSKGLGKVRLLDERLDVREHDFTTRDGLLAFVRDMPEQGVPSDASKADLPDRREVLTVELAWRPTAPVMVRDGREGAAVKTLPLTTRVGPDEVALTLPGSSIKGALRSHAEFVERTACGVDAPDARGNGTDADDFSRAFRAQLDQLDAVRALFGTARTDEASATPNVAGHPEHRWGSAALTVEDCVSTVTLAPSTWEKVVGAAPEEGDGDNDRPVLDPATRAELAGKGMDQADHVAIDRWTGGAAEHLLFNVLEPHGVTWRPVRLEIDLTRLGDYRDSALALLLIVLRDMRDGLVPLGGMVTRGFGDIEVGSVALAGARWESLDEALADGELAVAWERYWSCSMGETS